MTATTFKRAAPMITFVRAAPSYWCSVYPQVREEIAQQRSRAVAIPDSRLRDIALGVLRSKRPNIEGAAAFGAFVRPPHRLAVVRAQVTFQALYDYLDTVTEQPQVHALGLSNHSELHSDPVRTSRVLHGALSAALDAEAGQRAVQAYDERLGRIARADAGYLRGTVERCREALRTLPSYPSVSAAARRLTERIIDYQSFNVTDGEGPQRALARWAREETPVGCDLSWWETAASAGSSLGVFALIAMAAQPSVSSADALAVERAYFPWIGALHSLLDSLIDSAEDGATGQQSLVGHYRGPHETSRRLRRLAGECRSRAAALPQADQHVAILASMASLYLVEPEASRGNARPARREVLGAIGPLAAPAMLVLGARRLLSPQHDGI